MTFRRVNGEVHLDYTGNNAYKNEFDPDISVIQFDVNDKALPEVGWIENGDITEYYGELLGEMPRFLEGSEKLRLHKKKERSRKLRDFKIALTLFERGKLACEACTFDFNEVYGEIAHNYCEVHHNEKIAGGEAINGPDDLTIVCANCHRVIHQSEKLGKMITVEALRERLEHSSL